MNILTFNPEQKEHSVQPPLPLLFLLFTIALFYAFSRADNFLIAEPCKYDGIISKATAA